MADWPSLLAQGQYKALAAALIDDSTELDLDYLRDDPWGAIANMPALTILQQDSLPAMCGGGGYYDHRQKIIFIHPAGRRRNNFTLLHELGHHVQRRHPDWVLTLLDDVHSAGLRRKIEEAVSDQFAAQILLGGCENLDLNPFVLSPALVASGLYSNSMASRSAALEHVWATLDTRAKWILAVADLDGRVVYARSTYEQFPPKKGMVQPGFSRLAEEAGAGMVRRAFHEGMVYQGGRELHDMRVEAVLDFEGSHVFVGLTPIARFGQGELVTAWYSCDNAGCATDDFAPNSDTDWCRGSCSEPKCPSCGRCRCGDRTGARQCPTCWTEITAYEAANNLHEC